MPQITDVAQVSQSDFYLQYVFPQNILFRSFCSLAFLMNLLIHHIFITFQGYERLVTIALFLCGRLIYFTQSSLSKVSINWHPLHQCVVGSSWVCTYIQSCARVLMGMSHSVTLLHGCNEHQPLPVEGVIMELHGEQFWGRNWSDASNVMSEVGLPPLTEPQSALLLAKLRRLWEG